MALPLPPWIPGPIDLGAEWLGGLRAGSAIQAEQQRLAQESNLTQMRLMLQQQENERQNQLDQERLAQTRAYQQQEISIRKQQLEQAKAVNDIRIQEAARTLQAQQQFQQWLNDNPDKDPAEGFLRFFPGTGESAAGYGQLARSVWQDKQTIAPPELENIDVEGRNVPFLRIPEKGGGYRMQQVRLPGDDIESRQMRNEQRRELERRRDKLEASLTDADKTVLSMDPTKMDPATLKNYQAAKKKEDAIEALDRQIEAAYTGSGLSAPAPLAAPGGAQYRYNPASGKIEPVGAAAPAAPQPGADWSGGAAVMPRPGTANIQTPPGFGQQGGQSVGPAIPPGLLQAAQQVPQIGITQRGLSNLGAPFMPTLNALGRGAQGLAAPLMGGWQTLAPIIGQGAQNIYGGVSQLAPAVGQGAKNLVQPLFPEEEDPFAEY